MLDLADYTMLQDHSIAWGVYLAAAFILLLAYTRLTRRWWFELRWLLFAVFAVFFLVPAPVPGRDLLAPAMIMLALSKVMGSHEFIAAVIVRMLLTATAALVFVIIVSVIRRIYLRRRRAHSNNEPAASH